MSRIWWRNWYVMTFAIKWSSGRLLHFARFANALLKNGESEWNNHVLVCKFAKYSPILIFFHHRLSNKPFLIRLLTTSPHLKCVATLPWNLSLMVCFADINVSQGSIAMLPSVLWHCWLGGRKGIRSVKNRVVGCWRGYLSGARCRLAYGPTEATATHCLLLQLNPDRFYLSGTGSPG